MRESCDRTNADRFLAIDTTIPVSTERQTEEHRRVPRGQQHTIAPHRKHLPERKRASPMIGRLIGLLWWLLMLPIRLIKLPFKILSTIVSLILWGIVLLILLVIAAIVLGVL